MFILHRVKSKKTKKQQQNPKHEKQNRIKKYVVIDKTFVVLSIFFFRFIIFVQQKRNKHYQLFAWDHLSIGSFSFVRTFGHSVVVVTHKSFGDKRDERKKAKTEHTDNTRQWIK